MRADVRQFAELMERKLQEHDHRPGWEDDEEESLMERFTEELREVGGATSESRPSELIDVANFCMMIVCNRLRYLDAMTRVNLVRGKA